jgi:uncharacterized protein (TIGR01777 family)
MKKILITGGTGAVGTHLTQMLVARGYEVVILSRKAGIKNGIKLYSWNPINGDIDTAAFNQVNHVIHLAGAGIADHRWTDSYKKEIYDSRIQSTRLLVNTILQHNIQLDSFVSTSAIGIYGNAIQGVADESYPIAHTFLAKVCKDWENETNAIDAKGIRKVIVRVGVVLAKESGFIPEVAKPIKLFAGAVLGSGKQLLSWIHMDDLCGIYLKAIEDKCMVGPYNAVAPQPVSNKDITRSMAQKLHRPLFLPAVPEFMLRVLFGEVAGTLVADQAVSSKKIQEKGFIFQYPTLDTALNNLL